MKTYVTIMLLDLSEYKRKSRTTVLQTIIFYFLLVYIYYNVIIQNLYIINFKIMDIFSTSTITLPQK